MVTRFLADWPMIDELFVALVLAITGLIARQLTRRNAADRERDRKLDRLITLFEGEPADPFLGRPASLGLLGQINQLRQQVAKLADRIEAMSATT